MGQPAIQRKSGGSRKIGCNSKKCAKYRLEGRREINKRRRLEKLKKKYAKNKARRIKEETSNRVVRHGRSPVKKREVAVAETNVVDKALVKYKQVGGGKYVQNPVGVQILPVTKAPRGTIA